MRRDRVTDICASLALTCSRDGVIVNILRDDLGAAWTGVPLARIVDPCSAKKAETLITSLAAGECIVGWQLNVPVDNGARPLIFAGVASGESLIVLASEGRESSMDNQLYEELSRLNNELINRERELARKSAALQRLAAEKTRMVAMAAHDLRNPLTIVGAYADLLRGDAALSGEQLLYLDEISRSTRFMAELVEEMLDTARIESGHVDLRLHELDLVAAAAHAAAINRLRAERKEIMILFEAETDQAMIRADAVKLRQIINNLVVNAIKFSRSRGAVTIRVRRDEERAGVEVADQGIGIPRDQLTAIFEPFKTLASTGTAGEISTGLGLSIVKQLADLHDATIHVESEEGHGSMFRVAFPLIR